MSKQSSAKGKTLLAPRRATKSRTRSVNAPGPGSTPLAADFPAPFPIVAIGASAGGLEALSAFFTHVAHGCGMAFVVVQHLDPDRKGMLPELLQHTTAMPVRQAEERMPVRADCVYVIPPNRDLSILNGCLHLLEPVMPRGLRLPIDFFFRALADDRREHSVGVILSGMGSDGTLGLRAIKEHGGLTLVQDPATAGFDAMPSSAIHAGLAEIVGAPDELPQRIAATLRRAHPALPAWCVQEPVSTVQHSAFEHTCILLRARTGHDFSRYKRSTLYRRIERCMAIHQLDRIADYVRYLREVPQEIDLLFKELLIGVTSFFRDPAAWAVLQEQVLPALLSAAPESGVLRAWVAGCSTGEEAYSLAIVFREAVERLNLPGRHSLQIFATDIDHDAIDKARRGHYPANIAADVSEERLRRFFSEEGKGYRVGKEIREMVVFAPQNAIMDPPFTRLDLLTCRNLLIYFGPELQSKLIPLFHYSLRPGGVLMLGSAEALGSNSELFTPLDAKARLFRRESGALRANGLEFPTHHSPTTIEAPMKIKPEAVTANLQELADRLLLQKFSPAAVLVNAAGDLIYINGRTGKYLEPAAGKVNWNIHAMARDGLRNALALALPQALRGGETVRCPHLCIDGNGGTQIVDIAVYPIESPESLRGTAMVVFTDVAGLPSPGAAGAGSPPRRSGRQLETNQALLQARQEMQALREEMQASQEELKSANEELQSTNEELQSTNEELTTSKEEMQSLNEELQTVNVELQSKVDELSATNSDMNNLLNSTDLATIFLDNTLRVRRFTTHATGIFRLIPSDVGRALTDISTDLIYPELAQDAATTHSTLAFVDREIATEDGRWFQIKIMPYRTQRNVIDGVVITLSDISRAKRLEAELRAIGASPGK